MPYKSKKDQRAAQKRYRERQKRKLQKLQQQFPDVYQLIWGKKQRKRRRQ